MKLLTLFVVMVAMALAGCDGGSDRPPLSEDAAADGVTTYTITTIAGADAAASDGGPATEAFLNFPYSLAVDDAGNLYVADTENHRVRFVDAQSGVISTFAGTGEEGFGGDGGPATEARLDWPSGVALDSQGNVYIADQENERIRRVDPEGVITTFAGSGSYRYEGEEDGIPATEARLNWPTGVTVDAEDNVYIADSYNGVIRRVDASGAITTIAGSGRVFGFGVMEDEEDVGDDGPATEARLDFPTALAVDAAGTIYIADRGHDRVRRVDAEGTITTLAGTGEAGFSGDGGAAAEAQLSGPSGLALDDAGNLYVADASNNRVRRIDLATGTIATVAGAMDDGEEAPASAQIAAPRGVALDADGNLYIADTGNHQVRLLDADGTTMAVAGAPGLGDGEPAIAARLFVPRGITIDTDGTLYITDTGHNRVRKIDTEGIITTFAGTGEQGDGGDGGAAVEAQLNRPGGLTIGPDGHVYIADSFNNLVRKVDPVTGLITHVAGTGEKAPFEDEDAIGDGGPATMARLRGPIDLAFDADGNLYVTDALHHRIRRIDTAGVITTFAGSGERSFSGDEGPAAEAQLSLPVGLKIDAEGNFYLTDRYFDRNRIRKIDTAGIITTIAETASFAAVTVGPDGSVYITEPDVGRVLRLSPSGRLMIIAGSGRSGYGGDGGPALDAQLDRPSGIEIDADGSLYVVDSDNNRVRKLTPDG